MINNYDSLLLTQIIDQPDRRYFGEQSNSPIVIPITAIGFAVVLELHPRVIIIINMELNLDEELTEVFFLPLTGEVE